MSSLCLTCKHRRPISGDAHSKCVHPITEDAKGGIFNLLHHFDPITASKMEIVVNYYGVSQGWFNFPFNFDPVWMEKCGKYEKKD